MFAAAPLLLAAWVASSTTPFHGVTHIVQNETIPRPVNIHIVKVKLREPGLRLKLSGPSGPLEAVRKTTLDAIGQEKAQLAVNVHFFVPFPSRDLNAKLVGLAASDGKVYSAFEKPEQSYAIVADAPAINIDRKNRAAIVHRDFNDATAKRVIERVRLFNAISGSAQIITNGVKTIPLYRDAAHPDGLLTPGGPGNYSNQKSWYDVPNARTVAGLSRDNGILILFTVDRAAGSQGMTLGEVADLLIRDHAVYNALNLDGGGSTTLAMQDPKTREYTVVNKPSDVKGRAVASNLAIFITDAKTFWQKVKSIF